MLAPAPLPPETMTLSATPDVTLLVAMRNEAENIEVCLDSILAQDYPPERLEVLVFDGYSTDGSWEIAARVLADRPRAQLRRNPARIQAAAWNLGIDEAAGDVIGILSGHSILAPDYVTAAVNVLRRTGAAMVGGPVRALGDGRVAETIALAMSTPFGVGGAEFRYLDREQQVDTVFMGVSTREVYRAFRFDEEMVRNQDDELSYRLLDSGARIICSPEIRSSYRSRTTLGGLWRQYFDYGRWKVRVMQKHPSQVRWRHLVPTVFVCSVLGSLLLAIVWRPGAILLALTLTAYGAAMAVSIAKVREGGRRGNLVLLPVVYITLHGAYGLGVLAGLMRHRRWASGSLSLMARQLIRRARS